MITTRIINDDQPLQSADCFSIGKPRKPIAPSPNTARGSLNAPRSAKRKRHGRFAFAIAIIAALTLGPGELWASAAFKDVWFPDGVINWHVDDDASSMAADIRRVMLYMSDHTPLTMNGADSEGDANLRFKADWTAPNGGGYTYAYWDQTRSDSNKKIRFDKNHPPDRWTITHEFGHALGFPHEFQRSDRDNYVDVCENVDPFNYAKLGSAYWNDPYYLLSPYDYGSVMNDGYSSCVHSSDWELRNYGGSVYNPSVNNLLSVHDINGIYRMYGEKLGTNNDGDRFGVAVASGDYDDDGYQDIVVANLQNGGLWLSFFRGAAKSDVDELDNLPWLTIEHLVWVPWFKIEYDDSVASDEQITLATGDFNGDGIDDLAVGQPDYDNNRGRVSLLFVNTLPTDTGKDGVDQTYAPWGRKGIQHKKVITAVDLGLASDSGMADMRRPRLGASLATVHATCYAAPYYHDLVVGAPGAEKIESKIRRGAVIIIRGSEEESPSNFELRTRTMWNPHPQDWPGQVDGFGYAVSAVPGLCAVSGRSEQYYNDYIAVGAPAYDSELGAVHIYGCATSDARGSFSSPDLLNTIYGRRSGGRFGHALAGFRILFPGEERKTFLAVGQPNFAADDGLSVGQVVIQQIDASGIQTYFAALSPNNYSGEDEFGSALAVQQRPYAYETTGEAGYETYLCVGMPGAEVDGVRAGKVFVWRPVNSDGSVNYETHKVSASNPGSSTDTRFGECIAPLRNLQWEGGFVVGAPDAFTGDAVIAGSVSILQNDWEVDDWDTVRKNLDQETEGDKRPTNL